MVKWKKGIACLDTGSELCSIQMLIIENHSHLCVKWYKT